MTLRIHYQHMTLEQLESLEQRLHTLERAEVEELARELFRRLRANLEAIDEGIEYAREALGRRYHHRDYDD